MILYPLCQWIVRTGFPLIGRLDVRGLENIPAGGPFLLIANHQSILDPLLIQSVVRRPVHTMAKSTQFASPVMRSLMPRILSFPVRRYRVDPQAVRMVLRRLREGQGVGIYVEGERSWDGRLQEPRLGTVRLLLKAGVPVVPCGISGSYDVWPRWSHAIRRAPVCIRFGAPMMFPHLDRREDRERALPEATERLMGAIRKLLEQGC